MVTVLVAAFAPVILWESILWQYFVAIDNIEPFYCYFQGLHRENFDLVLLTVHGEGDEEGDEEGDIDSGFIE